MDFVLILFWGFIEISISLYFDPKWLRSEVFCSMPTFCNFPPKDLRQGSCAPLFSATTCQSFRSFHISFDLLLMIIILSHWEHLYWHRWQWWCWRWQMRLFFELILASMQLSCTSFFQNCNHSHWISLQTEQYYPISLKQNIFWYILIYSDISQPPIKEGF